MNLDLVLIILSLVIFIVLIYRVIKEINNDEKKNQELFESLDLPESKIIRKDNFENRKKAENWFIKNGFAIHEGDETVNHYEKKLAKMEMFSHYVKSSRISFLTKVDSKIVIAIINVEYDFGDHVGWGDNENQLVGIISAPNNLNSNEKIKDIYKRFQIEDKNISGVFNSSQLSCEIFEHKCYLKSNKVFAFDDLQVFIQLTETVSTELNNSNGKA